MNELPPSRSLFLGTPGLGEFRWPSSVYPAYLLPKPPTSQGVLLTRLFYSVEKCKKMRGSQGDTVFFFPSRSTSRNSPTLPRPPSHTHIQRVNTHWKTHQLVKRSCAFFSAGGRAKAADKRDHTRVSALMTRRSPSSRRPPAIARVT